MTSAAKAIPRVTSPPPRCPEGRLRALRPVTACRAAVPRGEASRWSSGLRPLRLRALAYDKPLCASLDGFTLHAATRAGGIDTVGREALLRYVLRPPIAQEQVEQQPDGLVRISLKKAYADGTVAVDMDPLSLLCRLATSVPPPRFHTIHYAGVLAAASPWRSRVTPPLPPTAENAEPEKRVRKSGYRPWAELLQRTFAVDVLTCNSCQGRMRLLAVVKNPAGSAKPGLSPAIWLRRAS